MTEDYILTAIGLLALLGSMIIAFGLLGDVAIWKLGYFINGADF